MEKCNECMFWDKKNLNKEFLKSSGIKVTSCFNKKSIYFNSQTTDKFICSEFELNEDD